ncbi:hypothetical protein SAMN05421878_11813 [Actinobaculum suis]|uniref:Uncharacterized protein n=1 Tax=Actinobaculum suis TaxID=1657 RepID=A0A1G7EIA9_9ACTO|nr:hypothetical protein [Actinobaculum suis]MDY5152553.1 hypothetical protein [Actinobaculum suis]SDE63378.1 hypothetical protein SAMN05421878_11813 [Actinobaculum suis]
MRLKNVFTLGFLVTIVLAFWVIISFARDWAFFDPISILGAIVGGVFVTLVARKALESDSNFPNGPRE